MATDVRSRRFSQVRCAIAGTVLAAAAASACGAAPETGTAFFQGKTVRIVVGAGPGGGYDRHARLLARHLGRYVPGNPAVVVTNMPGAGGLVAAAHVASSAPADGLTIGLFMQPPAVLPGESGPDIRTLAVLGSPAPLTPVCLFSPESGIGSLDAWRRAVPAPRFGATGPGGVTFWVTRTLKEALNLPVTLVSGYTGSPEIRLAIDHGEVDGTCITTDVLGPEWADLTPVLNASAVSPPGYERLPDARAVAGSERARAIIAAGIEIRNLLGRFYAVPDRVPAPRVALLRAGLDQALADPHLLREASDARVVIDPVRAADIEQAIAKWLADPALLAEVTALLSAP